MCGAEMINSFFVQGATRAEGRLGFLQAIKMFGEWGMM
jgi:hypothetical protein